MIFERIHHGETAGQIGIDDESYTYRRALLDRFLAQWTGDDFRADYMAWLPSQQEGARSCAGCKDRGLGDTVARITHATGLDKLAHLYTAVTGKDCGCQGRRDALNKLLPYRDCHQGQTP